MDFKMQHFHYTHWPLFRIFCKVYGGAHYGCQGFQVLKKQLILENFSKMKHQKTSYDKTEQNLVLNTI